jgi:hypothetical protein
VASHSAQLAVVEKQLAPFSTSSDSQAWFDVIQHATRRGLGVAAGRGLQELAPHVPLTTLLQVSRLVSDVDRLRAAAEATRRDAAQFIEVTASRLGEQLDAIETVDNHERSRDADRDAEAEIARERHSHLQELRELRAAREAREAAEAQAIADAERERLEVRAAAEAARRAEVAALASAYRGQKDTAKVDEAREAERLAAEARAALESGRAERKARVAARQQAVAAKAEQAAEQRAAAQRDHERHEAAVAAYLAAISAAMGIGHDTNRTKQATSASAARDDALNADRGAAPGRRAARTQDALHGFSDAKVHADPRTRIAAALSAAGLGVSEYGRSMIRALGREPAANRMSADNPLR